MKRKKNLNCARWVSHYVILTYHWNANGLDKYQGEGYTETRSIAIGRMCCFMHALNCYTVLCSIDIFCMNGLPILQLLSHWIF